VPLGVRVLRLPTEAEALVSRRRARLPPAYRIPSPPFYQLMHCFGGEMVSTESSSAGFCRDDMPNFNGADLDRNGGSATIPCNIFSFNSNIWLQRFLQTV
jgi:hypothetical protein